MKKKKKIVLLAVFLLIAAAWGAQAYRFNQEYPDVERKTYALQEEAELGKDIIDYDEMDGYFVTVESSQIYEYADFLAEYGLNDFMERYPPERIYLLKVRLRNTNNTETGVNFRDWYIQSNAVHEDINLDLYYEINQIDTYAVALREIQRRSSFFPTTCGRISSILRSGRTWKTTRCG
ncbi:MAG: hypothetical protein V8S32_02665 [Lachnospiraceae bacterium]